MSLWQGYLLYTVSPLPFYVRPPGTLLSSTASRGHGFIIRTLRRQTQFFQNRSMRWRKGHHIPSGWGHVREPNIVDKVGHFFYEKIQYIGQKKIHAEKDVL